ncbi:hypothetical protein ONS95_014329 [Cadophora gregata]|uniref:uncharacterized protein n=1 Tax=Cadophora gregata TaxID=51156 RepID=UPI0026DB0F4B|nr:uncharacterized protein ONS95_014329 [Cadophora gregata]KAK0112583.1 hypothetical protein ONS95_014329 [Cadophora gregata]
MPSLDVSELNIVLGVLGSFIVLYGIISVKIKAQWYLGEALPAVVFGIILGPIVAKFLDAERWGSAAPEQMGAITLGVARVVIGVQLVIAGFQLPAKYQLREWIPMMICLLPVMTIMWLFTTGCILLTVPKLTLLTGLVIGSCVTCTDPILSQAIAKGPFADKYVPRALREIISSEAGANDGFGFPFLMLATYLIRYADIPGAGEHSTASKADLTGNVTTAIVERAILHVREEEAGRLGGGVGIALGTWATETWVYIVFLSVVYGIVVGYGSAKAAKFALRKKWIDTESYLLMPTGLGVSFPPNCYLGPNLKLFSSFLLVLVALSVQMTCLPVLWPVMLSIGMDNISTKLKRFMTKSTHVLMSSSILGALCILVSSCLSPISISPIPQVLPFHVSLD